jgi:ATP-dependent Clp protease ATP-binding subunit ClpA
MQEALQAAQNVASEFNQQEITNEHFLLAALDQTDGVTRPLLEKVGVNGRETTGRQGERRNFTSLASTGMGRD